MNDYKKTPISFRTSMGGYNKDDVNRYIQQMHFQFSRAEEQKEAEITKLRQELSSKQQNADADGELKKENEELKARLEEGSASSAAMKAELEELRASLAAAREELDAAKATLEEKSTEFAAFREKTEGGEREQLAQRYEKMSCQLGDIFLTANADADRIRSEAEKEASGIRADAEKQASELIDRTNEKLRGDIEDAGNRLREAYRAAANDYEKILDRMMSSFRDAGADMEKRTEEFRSSLLGEKH